MSAPDRFDPRSYRVFRVAGRTYDPGSRTVTLRYALDDRVEFVETVMFETEPREPAPAAGPGFERALLHLHVAAGTSYFKTAAPAEVVVEGAALTSLERAYHHHLYDDGLREFAVSNGLPVPRQVSIRDGVARSAPAESDCAGTAGPPPGLVVPIGGGKDSLVLIEAVRHLRPRLFAVNPHPLVLELADRAGLELLVVRRRLDPGLAGLHAAGAWNGHVPVTAIVSLVALAGAFVYGYDTVAMAVERSASEETVMVDGVPVNHQYSKSREAELLLSELVRTSISADLTYGSGLRPYSELAIARRFAEMTGYHPTFCSCNTAFRRDAAPGDRWCGHCPKCRFVALMLAPYLSRDAVARVIGRDLFGSGEEVAGFAALMSETDKPFECVGERRESAAAFRLLADLEGWCDSPVVAALAPVAGALVTDADVAGLLTPRSELAFPDPTVAGAVEALLSGER